MNNIEIYNTKDLLNAHLYAAGNQNARTLDTQLYDSQAIAAGTTEYNFFVTPTGNPFLRNKQLPLSGTEVYFITAFSAYIRLNIDTTALIDALNELLQQSFLEIWVDGRLQGKYPGLDFINYTYRDTVADQVVVTVGFPKVGGHKNTNGFLGRQIENCPIVLNSLSDFRFRFVTTAAAATAFDTINLDLNLFGMKFDKLDSYYWNNLKSKQFQEVPVTYYQTSVIPGAAANTFQLFATPNQAPTLNSRTFPLSDITTFQLQNIEVFVNQPDVPIEPTTILNSRLTNVLNINVDDINWYNSNLQNILSIFAGFGLTLTTTPDTDYVTSLHLRQSKTLVTPLNIPATSNVAMTLMQPAASLGITGEITVALRGIETRRVA